MKELCALEWPPQNYAIGVSKNSQKFFFIYNDFNKTFLKTTCLSNALISR